MMIKLLAVWLCCNTLCVEFRLLVSSCFCDGALRVLFFDNGTVDTINTLHLKGCIKEGRNLGLNDKHIRKNNLANFSA